MRHPRCHLCRKGTSLSANAVLETLTAVRPIEIEQRPHRHNPARIDVLVAHVVMALDVIEADRAGDARRLVQVALISSIC